LFDDEVWSGGVPQPGVPGPADQAIVYVDPDGTFPTTAVKWADHP